MDAVPATAGRDVRAIGLIGTAHGFSHFYQLVLPPLFPLIHAAEGYSYTELGLLMSLFYAASGIFQTPAGFAVDRVGARPVLCAGLALLAAATLLCGAAPGYSALVVLCILAGVGNSVFHPADFSILSATVAETRMGRAFSIHAFAGLVGYAAAPVTVVLIAEAAGWRGAAAAAGAAGLVYLIAMAGMSRDFRDSAQHAADAPPGSANGGAALLVRLPVIMFLLFFVVIAMAHIGLQTFTPTALIAIHGMPLTAANGAVTGFLIGMPLGVLAGGMLADRTARHNLITVVCAAVPAVVVVFAGLATIGDVARLGLFVASGVVFGALFPARDLLVRAAAPKESSGKVFGFVYSGLDIGSALTPVAFGWLIDHGLAPWTFIAVAVCFALSVATLAVSALAARRPPAGRAG